MLVMRPPEKAQQMKRWNITSRDGQVDPCTTIVQRRISNKTEAEVKAKPMKNTEVEMQGDIQTSIVRGMRQVEIAMLVRVSTVAVEAEVAGTIEVGEGAVDEVGDTAAVVAAGQMADGLIVEEEVMLATVVIAAPMDGSTGTTIMMSMTIILRDESTGR